MSCKHRLLSTGHGTDFIVYRPAGGSGQQKSRRLRLGGKQEPAGCDAVNTPLTCMEATIGNQKKDNTKLFSISQVVEPQRWLLCAIPCSSGWLTHFAASLVSSSSH